MVFLAMGLRRDKYPGAEIAGIVSTERNAEQSN